MLSSSVVVLDFETTGLYPTFGDRIIEVAALRVEDGRITERFVTLVNPGMRISSFITNFTGISNEMVASAPPARDIMGQLTTFIGGDIVVAHNANFDRSFLVAECERVTIRREFQTICTLLLSRRLAYGLQNHKLATVAKHMGVSYSSSAHRAEADASVTAEIVVGFARRIATEHAMQAVSPSLLQQVTRWPRHKVSEKLRDALLGVSPERGFVPA